MAVAVLGERGSGDVVNLFARNRAAIALARNPGRALGYRCLVHYDTERAKEKRRGG